MPEEAKLHRAGAAGIPERATSGYHVTACTSEVGNVIVTLALKDEEGRSPGPGPTR